MSLIYLMDLKKNSNKLRAPVNLGIYTNSHFCINFHNND